MNQLRTLFASLALALALATSVAIPAAVAMSTPPVEDGYVTNGTTTMRCLCVTWPNGVKWCVCAG